MTLTLAIPYLFVTAAICLAFFISSIVTQRVSNMNEAQKKVCYFVFKYSFLGMLVFGLTPILLWLMGIR